MIATLAACLALAALTAVWWALGPASRPGKDTRSVGQALAGESTQPATAVHQGGVR